MADENESLNKEELEKLFSERKSVDLTPANARFFRSEGGLISLELKEENGDKTVFERVLVLRSLPITNPDEFISIREPDAKHQKRGREIGLIRWITDFDSETVELLGEELSRRYFTPQILKINSVKEKFGYSYWDAETSAGQVTFVLNNPFQNFRVLEDERVIINDIDGNCFEIPDPKKLDPISYKKVEIYI